MSVISRCGCASSQCTCSVVAGDGVFVEGSGSVNNPFKISVDASLSSGGGGFIPAFENAQPGSAFVILEPEDGWGVSPRPTSRDDLFFFFKGPTTPPVVSTGRNGMRDGIDTYLSTA